MADLPRYPGQPLWVKVQGSALILFVLIVLAMVIPAVLGLAMAGHGPGGHGPMRHATPAGQDQ